MVYLFICILKSCYVLNFHLKVHQKQKKYHKKILKVSTPENSRQGRIVMFKLLPSSYIRPASRLLCISRASIIPQVRYQSNGLFSDADLEHQKLSNDEKLDKWINALREFKNDPANQTRKHIVAKKFDVLDYYKPNEEQLAQYEAIKDKPLPTLIDPTIERLTNIMMKHGKKMRTRKTVSEAFHLVYLQTKLDPVEVFKKSVEKLAPIMKTVTVKTGFAKNVTSPVPLSRRQRERIAIKWIVDGCARRKSNDYSVRLAEEILSVWEGKSADFEKRNSLHKSCVAHRAFLVLK